MAKQSKKVISEREEQLVGMGFTKNATGHFEKGKELVTKVSVEFALKPEWDARIKQIEADSIPLIEGEHIPGEEDNSAANKILVPTMDSVKDIKALRDNPLVKAIANFEKEYKGLTFAGLEDKVGIEKIKAAKKIVQKTRTWITKTEDALKAPYIRGSKDLKAVGDEYRALIAPIEEPLDSEIDRFKALVDAEEIRKEEEAQREGNRRVEVLKEAGMTFDGQFYVIGESMSMDLSSIKAMPPADFEVFTDKVKKEQLRLDELEATKLKELKQSRLLNRGDMLKSIGFMYVEDGPTSRKFTSIYDDVESIAALKLMEETDEHFMKLFQEVSTKINTAKENEIQEAKRKSMERTVALRTKLVMAIGMKFVEAIPGMVDKTPGFYFKNDICECRWPLVTIGNETDDEFDKGLDVFEKEIKSAVEESARKEEENKAKEKLQMDRAQQLITLGMTRAPRISAFVFNLPDAKMECSVPYIELTNFTPDKWEDVIKDMTFAIAEIKNEQVQFEAKKKKDDEDRIAREKKETDQFIQRQYDLINLQLVIVGDKFIIKNEFGDSAFIDVAKVKALDEDIWPRTLAEVAEDVKRVKDATATKRNEALAKAEALKPQITKFREYLASFIDINVPKITEPELEEIMTIFKEDLTTAIVRANKALEKVNA